MSEHVVPKRVYYVIYGVLMFCTYLTVQIAFFDLGPLNTIAALTIAAVKATLVVLFFMHVKYASTHLTAVAIASGLIFLAILLTLTEGDYLTRTWLTFG